MIINDLDLMKIKILNYVSIDRYKDIIINRNKDMRIFYVDKDIRIFYVDDDNDTVIKTAILDRETCSKRISYNTLLNAVSRNRQILTHSIIDEYKSQSIENKEKMDMICELASLGKIVSKLYEVKDRDIIVSYTKDEYIQYLKSYLCIIVDSFVCSFTKNEPSLLSKKPRIDIQSYKKDNMKVFDTVRVTFTLIQGYGNNRDDLKLWLKKNQPMINEYVKTSLSSSLKKYNVSLNYLKCTNITLTKDNRLEYLFSFKGETEKNIDG